MPDIGYYAMPIIPSFEGIEATVNSELTQALGGNSGVGRRAGQAVGKTVGDGIAQGIAQAQAAIEASTKAIEKLRQKEADAAGKVRAAEAKLQELRDRGITSGSRFIAAEETRNRLLRNQEALTRDLRNETDRLTRSRADLANAQREALNNPETAEAAEDGGDEAGGMWMAGFATKLKGLAGKGGTIGLALVAAVGAVAGPAALLANELQSAFDREADLDRIAAGLQLNTAQIEDFGQAAKDVYGNNFGADLADVQEAMASVSSTFDVQGDALTGLTEKAITFRDVYGSDIPEVLSTAQGLVSTGLASSADEAMDLLANAFAKVPEMMRDEIGPLAREYGTVFNSLGFSGAEAFGMLTNAANVSEFVMDKVGDSLKEFTLLATDLGNQATQDLFTSWGMDGNAVANNILEGGQAAQDQFDIIVDKILEIDDAAQQAVAAKTLFGTPLEDLGIDQIQEFLTSIDTAGDAMADFEGAASDMVSTSGDNVAGTMESALRSIEIGRMEMQDELAKVFGPMVQDFAGWFVENKDSIIGFFEEVGAGALWFGSVFVGMVAQAVTVTGGFMQVWGDMAGWVADGIAELLGATAAALDALPDELVPDGWVDGIRGAQTAVSGWSDDLHDLGTDTTDFGLGLFDTAGQLALYGQMLHEGGIEMAAFTEAQQAAITEIKKMPDGSGYYIETNTPEVQTALEELGFTVEALPDGTIGLTANTDEAEGILGAFKGMAEGDPITIPARRDEAAIAESFRVAMEGIGAHAGSYVRQDPATGQWVITPYGTQLPEAPRVAGVNAYGSIRAGIAGQFDFGNMPTDAIIQPAAPGAGLIQWAEPSTHGEAFIPLAPDRRERSLNIWAETGRLLGAFAAGGINAQIAQIAALASSDPFGLQLTSGSRPGDGTSFHASGQAGDFSNGTGNTPEMLAFANMMADTYGSQLAELIYDAPGFNKTIKDGQIVGPFGAFYTMAQAGNHQNHVHIAVRDTTQLQAGTSNLPLSGATPSGVNAMGNVVDQGAVQEATGNVAEADARVRELEAKNAEVQADADAAESDKIGAQNDLDSARRDAEDARRELAEAQAGTPADDTDTASADSSGPGPKDIASLIGEGFMETLGLDGSWLPDISELGPMKLLNAIMGIKYKPVGDGLFTGGLIGPGSGGEPHGGMSAIADPSAGVMEAVTSMLPFGLGDMVQPGAQAPVVPPPVATGVGTGPAPGPTTAITVNGYSSNDVVTQIDRQQRWATNRQLTYSGGFNE